MLRRRGKLRKLIVFQNPVKNMSSLFTPVNTCVTSLTRRLARVLILSVGLRMSHPCIPVIPKTKTSFRGIIPLTFRRRSLQN